LCAGFITFTRAFETNFGCTLRERRAPTLEQIQVDALGIEANLVVAGKALEVQPTQDKGKANIESSQSQALEDMNNVIRNLLNKLIKLELESNNS